MQPTPFTWIAENSMEAALMATIVLPVCWFARSRPAVCHLLWLLILVKLVAPPLPGAGWQPLPVASWMESAADGLAAWVGPDAELAGSDWRPPAEAADPAKPLGVGGAMGAETSAPVPLAPLDADTGSSTPSVAWWKLGPGASLLLAWLAGSFIVLVLQLRQALAFHRLVESARPASSNLLRVVRRTATLMGVSTPAVRQMDGLASPVIWSLGRPVFLWPSDVRLGPAVDSVVAHELAHLRRRDHWIAWLELAAMVVCWWNPIFWFARRRVRRYAEQASDAWAVWALPELRRGFAEALIDVAARRSGPSISVAVPAVSESKPRDFQRRLTMIMQSSTSRRTSPAVAGLAIAATIFLMPSLSGAEPVEERALPDASLEPAIAEATYGHKTELARESGDWKVLAKQAKRMTHQSPENAKAWNDYGYALLQLGEPDQALDAFRRQLDVDEKAAWAEYSMASAFAQMDQPDEAFAHLQRAVERGLSDTERIGKDEMLNPIHSDARWGPLMKRAAKSMSWMKKADAARESKDWPVAIEAYHKRIQLAPNDGRAIHLLAYASFGTRDYDTALEMCERHIAMGYRTETGYYNVACARALTGDIEGGVEAIEMAFAEGFYDGKLFLNDSDLDSLREDPRVIALTEEVEQQVVLWKQGEKAAKSGDWSLAADAYEQIVKHRPQSGEALAELAWFQARAGDDVSAIESYGAAVRQGHKVRNNLYQLARCHARLGQAEAALTYLDLSLATGFNKGQAMADDEAFAALADDSRFSALVEAARAAGHRADKSDSYGGKAKKSDAWSETETI